MRFAAISRSVTVFVIASHCAFAAAELSAPNTTIGCNLQTSVTMRLPETKGRDALKLTITSDDPSRLLVANAPDKPGSASISLTALTAFMKSPPFWLQARADSGVATYTVSVEGVGSAKGTVTMMPSTIIIIGPLREPKYRMTPRATPAKITIVAASLTNEGKVGAEQELAGASKIEVAISNSEPKVGALRVSKLPLLGGTSFESTFFDPAAEGETTLAPVQPPGFQAAKEYANVVMAISKPGMAIEGNIYLGKDLQVAGSVILGEPAPPDGLEVTITSSDPSKLVFSLDEHKPGSGSIKLRVPAGQFTAPYYIQALGDSGIINCEAAAPAYRTRVTRIGLARSGVILAYDPYGPPDEAAVLRKSELKEDRAFFISLDKVKNQNTKLVVWSAYLDPDTGQAADITVQPLRAGVKATVNLTSSNPAIGTVESPLTIESGNTHAISRFTALSKGVTMISIDTPTGFTTPKNATRIPANVSD